MPPFSGSGSFTVYTPGNPVVTGTTISSSAFNNTMTDFATGLTNTITRDGQSPATANIPFGGYKITGLGSGTARTDGMSFGQAQDGAHAYLTSVSGTDTITASLSTPTLAAYATGMEVRFVSAGANTGAVTLNVNSLGAKAVTKEGTTALVAGDIPSGAVVTAVYDGTRFQLTNIGGFAKAGANGDITSLTAITAGGLPNSTITTATIADLAITTAKIDNGQVTIDKLAMNSVSTTRILDANVTAAKLDGAQSGSAPIFGARAWVRFNGTGTVAIGAAGNVSSITDRGSGAYTVNFTTAMSDANYATVATAGTPAANTAAYAHLANGVAPTTSAVAVDVITDGGTRQDATYVSVVVYR